MHLGIYVKYPLFVSILTYPEYSLQIFEKYSNIKFHENSSSGSRVVPCGRKDGQTDRHVKAKYSLFAMMQTRLITVKLNVDIYIFLIYYIYFYFT